MYHGVYTVVAGDTLTKIADELGMSLDEVLEANPDITDPNQIAVGQSIQYPDSMVNKNLMVPQVTANASGPRSTGASLPLKARAVKADLLKAIQDPKVLVIGAVGAVALAMVLRPKKRAS